MAQSLTQQTAGLEEVAAALGKTPDWLRRRWLRLHQERGFPRKLAGWVWPRRAVEAWIAAEGMPPVLPLAANSNDVLPADALVAQQHAALRQRYGAGE